MKRVMIILKLELNNICAFHFFCIWFNFITMYLDIICILYLEICVVHYQSALNFSNITYIILIIIIIGILYMCVTPNNFINFAR